MTSSSIAPPPPHGSGGHIPHPLHSAHRRNGHARKIAIFGGSFDPIHNGHIAVARAAQRRFHLDEIHFIPSGRPPHKHHNTLAPYTHRYTMVALACAAHDHWIPSLAEAGPDGTGRAVFYSIETLRHYKREFHSRGEHLYFLLGADAFLQLPTWKDYEALLDACDFIVASRPGFRMEPLRLVIPPELLGRAPAKDEHADPHTIYLRRTRVHLLDTVSSEVSATEIRRRLDRRQSIHGLVPAPVEEYIGKQALYR